MIERPLDLLGELKQKKVKVTFKDGKEIEGKLLTFDIHINIILQGERIPSFYRGDNIISIESNED